MALKIGKVVKSRYRIEGYLGEGGFGKVYRAWDTNLERWRVIKENKETAETAQRQFKREAQFLADLSHPNLPKVIDYFFLPNQGQYLVMEYIEGRDLQELLAQAGGPLPVTDVLRWAGQVCEALAYLHSRTPPIIHRDVKPNNIRITPGGQAVLVDFGIAKFYDPDKKTTMGAHMVTPGYSPFEQYGQSPTDGRSDIYALGATLYCLLGGQMPVESIARMRGAELPALLELNPGIPENVAAAIQQAMEMMPERRFREVDEFRQALIPPPAPPLGREGRIPPPAPPVTPPPAPPLKGEGGTSNRSGGTVKVGSAASGVGTGTLPYEVPETPPKRAEPEKAPLPWDWIGRGAGAALLVVGCLAGYGLVAWLAGWPPFEANEIATPTRDATLTAQADAATQTELSLLNPPTFTPSPNATPSQTPLPTYTPTSTLIPTPETPPGMALIPAGTFQMGSENGEIDERPVHTVHLDAFHMDIYEVTNALYEECVSAGACQPPYSTSSYSRSSYYGDPQYADYPVIHVSWNMARAYCQWKGSDLPTEAQWEKAARGGLEGADYPWGNEAPTCQQGARNGAQYASCSQHDTVVVGSFAANDYGLFDMAGNVWEWVLDWYGSYGSSPLDNPFGPSSGDYRVLRGGAWNYNEVDLRVAIRFRFTPVNANYYYGFRCSRSR